MAVPSAIELPSLQDLQSIEQLKLLDVVDTLRARGLGEIVALPQLIVCGDQSSGKSSVLEAISGIPFPRQQNLCTRFATEVILRRASTTKITASILPGKRRTKLQRGSLLQFRQEIKSTDDLKGIFDTAIDTIGLSDSGPSFSDDVLRIEFCGPSQPPLTLVDLPGIIHSTVKQQTIEDVNLVHNLLSEYLQNPRSIILAVVSAKNDSGNQIILKKARDVDPDGLRTLGIITKPDTLTAGSINEKEFIALASNERVKFTLGWHVVRNLDLEKENEDHTTRDEKEAKFFSESNFKSLRHGNYGIGSLRERLSKVLFDQIRTELPQLANDISAKISATKEVIQKLGPSRSKIEDQQSFLLNISESFQRICEDAIRGHYEDEFFQIDTNTERRLWANIMNKHFEFANAMRKEGGNWIIVDKREFGMDPAKYLTRQEAILEACRLLKNSRGRELPGLPNPLLVGQLFREYSRPWGTIARDHIKNVWETTLRFLELILKHLTDDDACEKILRFWITPIMEEKLTVAYEKLDELLEVHKDHPLTTNSQFIMETREHRQKNVKEDIGKRLQREITANPGATMSADDISRIIETMKPLTSADMDLMAAEEAFDSMNSFYQVALNLFMDNVPTLAIQAPIIRAVSAIFCPTKVISMDPDTIKKVAGEDENKSFEREALLDRLEILERGAEICKQYKQRPKPTLGLPQKNHTEPTSGTKSVVPKGHMKTHSFEKAGGPMSRDSMSSSDVTGGAFSLFTTAPDATLPASSTPIWTSSRTIKQLPTRQASSTPKPARSMFDTPSPASSTGISTKSAFGTPNGIFGSSVVQASNPSVSIFHTKRLRLDNNGSLVPLQEAELAQSTHQTPGT